MYENVCLFAGGAISNMYSVMVARYKHYPEVKIKGMAAVPRLVLFTSEHVCHLFSLSHRLCISLSQSCDSQCLKKLKIKHACTEDKWNNLLHSLLYKYVAWIKISLTESLLNKEGECSAGFWHRESHLAEHRWKVREISRCVLYVVNHFIIKTLLFH